MKKWIVCVPVLLIALTGCQSLEEKRAAEREALTYYVDSTLGTDVNQETQGWEMLKKVAGKFEKLGCDIIESDYYVKNLGIYEMNGSVRFWNFLDYATTEEIEQLSTVVGEEIVDLIHKAKELESGEAIERVVNDYGIGIANSNNGYYTRLYITHSGLTFNDQTLQNKIEILCEDQLLISSISRGEDKQIVELSYPIAMAGRDISDLPPSVYYKVIMNTEGYIEKVKMVISSYYSDNKILQEEKYNHLESMLEEISGEALEITGLKQKICQGIEDGKEADGSLGSWNYAVETKSSNRNYEQLTVVEFTRD